MALIDAIGKSLADIEKRLTALDGKQDRLTAGLGLRLLTSGKIEIVPTDHNLGAQLAKNEKLVEGLSGRLGAALDGIELFWFNSGHSIGLRDASGKQVAKVSNVARFSDIEATHADIKATAASLLKLMLAANPGSIEAVRDVFTVAQIAELLTPEEIARFMPDVVALCEPDECWFTLSTAINNNVNASRAVKSERGMLLRSHLPQGMTTLNICSADKVHYLDLKGFRKFSARRDIYVLDRAALIADGLPSGGLPPANGAFADPSAFREVSEIRGCVNMADLTHMNFPFKIIDRDTPLAIYGDWSSARNVGSYMGLFGDWGDCGKLVHVPDRMSTEGAATFYMFSGTYGVERYPEIDCGKLTGEAGSLFFDSCGKFYPGTVYARVRGIGREPMNDDRFQSFRLLKNWDYDDMKYTLITASVYNPDKATRVQLHPDTKKKLTQADLAAIVAKNLTIFTNIV